MKRNGNQKRRHLDWEKTEMNVVTVTKESVYYFTKFENIVHLKFKYFHFKYFKLVTKMYSNTIKYKHYDCSEHFNIN